MEWGKNLRRDKTFGSEDGDIVVFSEVAAYGLP